MSNTVRIVERHVNSCHSPCHGTLAELDFNDYLNSLFLPASLAYLLYLDEEYLVSYHQT